MCIGVPMQIEQCHNALALCTDGNGQQHEIDIMLVGPQTPGTWVMTFLNTAREVIPAEQAMNTIQALQALEKVQRGEDFEHLFADLINREPKLPEFLRQPDTTNEAPPAETMNNNNTETTEDS